MQSGHKTWSWKLWVVLAMTLAAGEVAAAQATRRNGLRADRAVTKVASRYRRLVLKQAMHLPRPQAQGSSQAEVFITHFACARLTEHHLLRRIIPRSLVLQHRWSW